MKRAISKNKSESASQRGKEPLGSGAGAAEPFCTVREVSTAVRDYAFLEELVREIMPRYRMNRLHLWSVFPEKRGLTYYLGLPILYRRHPKMARMRSESRFFQEGCEAFRKFLALAAQSGIGVNMTFCIFNYMRMGSSDGTDGRKQRRKIIPEDFPGLPWKEDGSLELDSDAVGEEVAEELDELFETYPQLGGIMVHTAEMAAFGFGHMKDDRPDDWNARVTRRMLSVVDKACRQHGRYAYWDLHGNHPGYFQELKATLGSGRYPHFAAKSEGTHGEQIFGRHYPSFPARVWREAGIDLLLNHDVVWEGMDYPWLPCILTEYITRHVRHAAAAGVKQQGAMLYHYESAYPCWRNLAEINLLVLSELMGNPEASVDEVWARWLRQRFGEEGTAVAGPVLKAVPRIIDKILYVEGAGNLFLQYRFPSKFSIAIDDWFQTVEFFQPAGTPVISHFHNSAAGVKTPGFAVILREKDEAVADAADGVAAIEAGRGALGEERYRELLPRFVGLHLLARAARLYVENLWAFSNARIRAYDVSVEQAETTFKETLSGLRALAAECRNDPRMRLLPPDIYGSLSDSLDHLYACSFLGYLPLAIERYVEDASRVFASVHFVDALRRKFEANAKNGPAWTLAQRRPFA